MYTSLLMVLGACATGQADDGKRPLVWAADPNGGIPYVFKDKKGFVGFEVDLKDALAEELGRPINIRDDCDFDKLFQGLNRGDFDFAMNGLEITPENLEKAHFTRPYYVYQLQLVVRQGEKRFRSLPEAYDHDMTIGTLSGSAAERLLNKLDMFDKGYPDQDGAFKDLSQGANVQGVLMDLPIALYYAVSALPQGDTRGSSENFLKYAKRIPGLEFAGNPTAEGFYGIAVRKDNKALAASLNKALNNLLQNGKLKNILQKWDLWNVDQYRLLNYRDYIQGMPPEDDTDNEEPQATEGGIGFFIYFPYLLEGAWVTVKVTFCSMALAILLALPISVCRMYGPLPVRWLAIGYIEFFRGIPVLLLLVFLYYTLGDISRSLKMEPFHAAVLGFALNYAAYEAEVYRAAISAVPQGQWEAAVCLGMSPWQTFRRIILPQSIRGILPPMTNDFVALFKDTSLVSVITVTELNKQYQVFSRSGADYIQIAATTAALYLIMSVPLGYLSRYLERRWGTK